MTFEPQKIKLGECLTILDGDRGNNYPKKDEFLNSGYCLFLNTKNVPGNLFSFDEVAFITEEKDNVLRKGKIQRGDYVFTTRGTIGNFAYYSNKIPYENIRINSGMVVLRANPDKIYEKFLLYVLDNTEFKQQVKLHSSGSAQPQLPIRDMKHIEVSLPPLPTQKKIASILSNYDDLIENNTRRIKILEEQAQLIYKEWFVNYKFPGHEDVKMVDSGTEFGMIPEGWEVKEIQDFGDVITGKTPSTREEKNYGNYMMFIKTPDMHSGIFCTDTSIKLSMLGEQTQKNKTIPENSLLISCIGTLGVVCITSEKSQFNQQINAVVPFKRDYLEYLYCLFVKLKKHLENIGSNGATMGNVNKEKFQSIKVLKPDDGILGKYHSICDSIFSEILNLQKQNQNLKQTRDMLIPKLVSGEVLV